MHAIRSHERAAPCAAFGQPPRPAVLTIALIVLATVLLIAATAAHAAAAASAVPAIGPSAASAFAAPARAGASSTAGGLLRVALALVVVLGAIFGAGWLSRRVHGTRGARHPGLEVLAQLPLGPRERAVLIRVGAQQLLVGVCGGCIRTLHVCTPDGVAAGAATSGSAADAVADAATLVRPTFKSLLLKSLGK